MSLASPSSWFRDRLLPLARATQASPLRLIPTPAPTGPKSLPKRHDTIPTRESCAPAPTDTIHSFPQIPTRVSPGSVGVWLQAVMQGKVAGDLLADGQCFLQRILLYC